MRITRHTPQRHGDGTLVTDLVYDSEVYKNPSLYRAARIWRYDTLEHVSDVLRQSSLYVSRADQFDDRYEGLFFVPDSENRDRKLFVKPVNADHYYVSCWHINERENISWWERYRSGKTLAIQTTVGQLIDSIREIPEQSVAIIAAQVLYAGSVANRAHIAGVVDPGVYENFLVKDSDFSHEQEFRLICRIPEKPEALDTPTCIRPPINLDSLQGRIVVSPFCSPQERKSIHAVLTQYDCGLKIEESSLVAPESADITQSVRVWSDRLMRLVGH